MRGKYSKEKSAQANPKESPVFVCLRPSGGTREQRPTLTYLRAAGFVAILFGMGSFMLTVPLFFWVGVGCMWVGFAAIILDVALEQSIKWGVKILFICLFAAFALFFSGEIVFYPAPLDVAPSARADNYAEGTNVHGIIWKLEYTDLRLSIENPTNRDYDDLDIGIEPDQSIFAHIQVTSLPCDLIDFESSEMFWPAKDAKGNRVEALIPLQAFPHFRLRCSKLPRAGRIELVIAIAKLTEITEESAKNPESLKPHRVTPKTVSVFGSYTVTLRPHFFRQQYEVKIAPRIPAKQDSR